MRRKRKNEEEEEGRANGWATGGETPENREGKKSTAPVFVRQLDQNVSFAEAHCAVVLFTLSTH